MPAYLHQAYRRNAQAAAQKHRVKKHKDEDLLERAREDFGFFCGYIDENKKPAKHHLDWHKYLVTNQDTNCLLKIGGPNIDLLAPRGSAKSTILGLFTAWLSCQHLIIGRLPSFLDKMNDLIRGSSTGPLRSSVY